MLIMFRARVKKPAGMSRKEFYAIWREEARASVAAIEQGAFQGLWKVAGCHEVVGVFNVPDGDAIDGAIESLPVWAMGHSDWVEEIEFLPIRPYEHWAADLERMAEED